MSHRLHLLALIVVALGPISGCGPTSPSNSPLPDAGGGGACDTGGSTYPVGTTVGSIVHQGLTRTFRVHVPPGASSAGPRPLVLMFHGGGGSGLQFESASSHMDEVADREGFVVVYPDGTGTVRTWNAGGCCGSSVANSVDDVGFVRALLDHLESTMCLDTRRVFASGMSNGAMLVHRLGCELADRLAAIAPVSGTDMTASCHPSRAIPVMHTHGTADAHVPWNGGVGCGPSAASFTSVPTTIARWKTRDGCTASTSTPGYTAGEGHCESWGGCTGGSEVVLCTIDGGGHNWPGGDPPADVTPCPGDGIQSSTFHASEVVWSFFAAHPMPAP